MVLAHGVITATLLTIMGLEPFCVQQPGLPVLLRNGQRSRPPCAPGPPFAVTNLDQDPDAAFAPTFPCRAASVSSSPRARVRYPPAGLGPARDLGTQDHPPLGLLRTTCKADTLNICKLHVMASGSEGLVSVPEVFSAVSVCSEPWGANPGGSKKTVSLPRCVALGCLNL